MNEYLKTVEADSVSNDPDNTKNARKFYSTFWSELISPDVDMYNGNVGNYRGETIISFNTIAGYLLVLLPINSYGAYKWTQEERLNKILSVDSSIKKMVEEFNRLYHSKANFMPLPYDEWNNSRNPSIRELKNLNQIKGSFEKYCDFPDEFFSDIKRIIENTATITDVPGFNTRLNQKYFELFNGSWKQFVEKNYLQPFFEDKDRYSNFVKLAPSDKFPRTWTELGRLSEEEADDCLDEIIVFLTNAIKIIKQRAELLSGN